MKRNITLTLLLTSVLAASALLGGCSAASTPAAAPAQNAPASSAPAAAPAAPAEQKKNVKLDFMWWSDGVEGETTQAIIKDYQAANPNVTLNLIEIPYNEYENKLKISISGGEPPALSRISNVGLFKDVAVNIDEYVEKDKLLSQFNESLYGYFVYDDHVKGLPIDVTANGLIYNKTAFEKAGVKVPTDPNNIWTIEEWIQAMKTVMEKGDVKYGLVVDRTIHRFSTLLYGQGGRWLDDTGKKVVLNNEAGVKTIELFKRLHDEKICPDSVWVGSENPNNLFRTGQIAMHLAGSWMMTNYRDNIKDFEWGVTYLPVGVMRSSVPGGKYVMAFDKTGLEKEAVDFITYFTETAQNERYCKESLFISPRKDLANIDFSFGKEYFAVFANELANTPEYVANDWAHPKLSASLTVELREGIADAIAGKIEPQALMDKVTKIAQDAIDE